MGNTAQPRHGCYACRKPIYVFQYLGFDCIQCVGKGKHRYTQEHASDIFPEACRAGSAICQRVTSSAGTVSLTMPAVSFYLPSQFSSRRFVRAARFAFPVRSSRMTAPL